MGWWFVGALGLFVLGIFAWVMRDDRKNFDSSRLGLLTLGLAFVSLAVLQPKSFKWGDVQLAGLAERAEQATANANEATARAEDSRQLAVETTAFLLWNFGRWGVGGAWQEKMARKALQEVYGSKTDQVVGTFQHMGVFATAPEDLLRVPKKGLPPGVRSPFLERFAPEVQEMHRLLREQK